MTRSLVYIGALVLVVGLLLTTCVGAAWSMDMLTDEQLGEIRGSQCHGDCCEGCALPGDGSGCEGGCGEAEWPCKRIGEFCSWQRYHAWGRCKMWEVGYWCDDWYEGDCMQKWVDDLPPDEDCEAECVTPVGDPPCGRVSKCYGSVCPSS